MRCPGASPTDDLYAVLGVASDARSQVIRAAYLDVMRASHPDLHPGDDVAGDRARQANAAWAVLGDPAARARYDRARATRQRRAAAGNRPRAVVTANRPRLAPAYVAQRAAARRAFQRASVRVGAATVAFGTVLLLSAR